MIGGRRPLQGRKAGDRRVRAIDYGAGPLWCTTEMVDDALIVNLQAELEAVARAEERILAGAYGRSIDSGVAIPDERLEADPLAERTVEEQRRVDAGQR